MLHAFILTRYNKYINIYIFVIVFIRTTRWISFPCAVQHRQNRLHLLSTWFPLVTYPINTRFITFTRWTCSVLKMAVGSRKARYTVGCRTLAPNFHQKLHIKTSKPNSERGSVSQHAVRPTPVYSCVCSNVDTAPVPSVFKYWLNYSMLETSGEYSRG
jgi:hypothetical protein